LRRQSAEAEAEPIIAKELQALKRIAAGLQTGTSKSSQVCAASLDKEITNTANRANGAFGPSPQLCENWSHVLQRR
jgi:hypothetical protein